ncbi:hypothetical protein ACFYSC_12930 [Streptosporangium sp. NPDC004379]|uniref:hypothetical protein n=1 Tax=Streptosporangium sp. NPDC004379 TaxID=3366189 RepID=UPI00367E4C10
MIPPLQRERADLPEPQRAGDRPRLLSDDEEAFVAQTAITRPVKLGQPFTRWSIRKLTAYLQALPGRTICIGHKVLRALPARRGITFQHTKTWIEYALTGRPERTFAFNE